MLVKQIRMKHLPEKNAPTSDSAQKTYLNCERNGSRFEDSMSLANMFEGCEKGRREGENDK